MKLGSKVQFHISTNDVGASVSFYKIIGFAEAAYGKKPFRWIMLADGELRLFLAENDFSGLSYHSDKMEEQVGEIRGKGIEFVKRDLKLGETWYKVVNDPNDFSIALVKDNQEYRVGKAREDFKPLGSFSEISILSKKIKESVEFWNKLGFKIIGRNGESDRTQVSLSDGNMGIGLYAKEECSHYFEAPAIKYISENMNKKIQELKDTGMEFQQEIKNDDGKVTDAILLSPEGQTFFLFSK